MGDRGGIGIRARLRGVSSNGYGFKSRRSHHIKYQLLIQRLVLFFYPMVAQIPLRQGLSQTFFRKGIADQFQFLSCTQAR